MRARRDTVHHAIQEHERAVPQRTGPAPRFAGKISAYPESEVGGELAFELPDSERVSCPSWRLEPGSATKQVAAAVSRHPGRLPGHSGFVVAIVAVRHPFAHVAEHVMHEETVGPPGGCRAGNARTVVAWKEIAGRDLAVGSVEDVPSEGGVREVLISAGLLRILLSPSSRPPIPGPCDVLPFGLGGQAAGLAGPSGEPVGIGGCVPMRDAHHRVVGTLGERQVTPGRRAVRSSPQPPGKVGVAWLGLATGRLRELAILSNGDLVDRHRGRPVDPHAAQAPLVNVPSGLVRWTAHVERSQGDDDHLRAVGAIGEGLTRGRPGEVIMKRQRARRGKDSESEIAQPPARGRPPPRSRPGAGRRVFLIGVTEHHYRSRPRDRNPVQPVPSRSSGWYPTCRMSWARASDSSWLQGGNRPRDDFVGIRLH